MTIEEKVRAVEEVMSSLDTAVGHFKQWSGLNCKAGCGKCCFKPDIEATALEFLPLAHHLFVTGKAEEWLDRLTSSDELLCPVLDTSLPAGMCSEYKHRGLICRLFGFSARMNKYSKRELVTCQIIKTEQNTQFKFAADELEGQPVPITSQYYMQLHAVDFEMAREFFPIRKAIQRALQIILHYYAYRS